MCQMKNPTTLFCGIFDHNADLAAIEGSGVAGKLDLAGLVDQSAAAVKYNR